MQIRSQLKIVLVLAGFVFLAFSLFCSLALLAWKNTATGQDAEASVEIRDELAQAIKTNFQRQIDIEISPLKNKTIVHVETHVSEIEKERLYALVRNIRLANHNRPISIIYQIKQTNSYTQSQDN